MKRIKNGREPGATRKERKPATYRKTAENKDAVLLKLADRIANVEASLRGNRGLLQMYTREQPDFKAALYSLPASERADALWRHLDSLLASSEVPCQ